MLKSVASNVFTKSTTEMNASELLLKTLIGLGNGYISFDDIFPKFKKAAQTIQNANGLSLYENCFCQGSVKASIHQIFVRAAQPCGSVNKTLLKIGYVLKSKKEINGYLFKLVKKAAVSPANKDQLNTTLVILTAQNDSQTEAVRKVWQVA